MLFVVKMSFFSGAIIVKHIYVLNVFVFYFNCERNLSQDNVTKTEYGNCCWKWPSWSSLGLKIFSPGRKTSYIVNFFELVKTSWNFQLKLKCLLKDDYSIVKILQNYNGLRRNNSTLIWSIFIIYLKENIGFVKLFETFFGSEIYASITEFQCTCSDTFGSIWV